MPLTLLTSSNEIFDIAGLNRDRFNEAVAAGNYPCAPQATRGAPRGFDEDDFAALVVYARKLDIGMPPKAAGQFACEIRKEIEKHPKEKQFVGLTSLIDEKEHIFKGSDEDSIEQVNLFSPLLFRTTYEIENAREMFRQCFNFTPKKH